MKASQWDRFTQKLRSKQCNGAMSVLLTVAGLIGLYWIWRKVESKRNGRSVIETDILNKKIVDIDWLDNCCSWWPISHFVLFFFLGVFFPDCDVPVLLAGILWEGVETVLSWTTDNKNYQAMRTSSKIEVQYSKTWWAGSFKDIIFNFAGFYTGKILVLTVQSDNRKRFVV